MREIRCTDGMLWRIEAMATPAGVAERGSGEDSGAAGGVPRVALLVCVTCEGAPRQVTIRAPAEQWRDMSGAELCRLIAEAEATDV